MNQVIKHIEKVRTEMRFYLHKEVPGYSKATADQMADRLQERIHLYGRRLRIIEPDTLRRQKVIKELNKLLIDFRAIDFKHNVDNPDSFPDVSKTPILKPLKTLCDMLGIKPLTNPTVQ
jgi:hypothetical protein